MNLTEMEYQDLLARGGIGLASCIPHGTPRQTPIATYALPAGDPYANQLERDYAEHLAWQVQEGALVDWKYQPFRLILAQRTAYTPDFVVVTHEYRLECHEVKGFWRDDARVKIKVAARLFPWFRFRACTRLSKKRGWTLEEIAP